MTQTQLGRKKLKVFAEQGIESHRWHGDRGRVQNIPRIHYVGHPQRNSELMKSIQCEPEQSNGRIIFMSMYNDIKRRENGNTKECIPDFIF